MARNCVNNQYTFQEFLLECPYDGIMIENYMMILGSKDMYEDSYRAMGPF